MPHKPLTAVTTCPDIYISHSSSDAVVAARITDYLEAHDLHCCTASHNITSSSNFGISPATIQTCRIVLLLFSTAANESSAVQDEVNFASNAGKIIIPFRLEDVLPKGSLEANLRRRYKLDAYRSPLEVHLEELTRILKPLKLKEPSNPLATSPITGTLAELTPRQDRGQPFRHLPLSHEPDGPIRAFLDFHHPLIIGHDCYFEVKLENQGALNMDQIKMIIDSGAVNQPVVVNLPDIPPNEEICHMVGMKPIQAGNILLKFSLEWRAGSQQVGILGYRSILVHAIPPKSSREESAEIVFDNFEPLEISFEYKVSIDEEQRAQVRNPLVIPDAFSSRFQEGSVLQFVPVESSATGPSQPIRLVARSSFSLGRSREEADYLTWFWPRNELHDAKTRRLSKKQCVLGLRDSRIYVCNTSLAGHTMFDGQEIIGKEGVRLEGRGILNLSNIYFVDVVHVPSGTSDGLRIKNGSHGDGPKGDRVLEPGGCVRFVSVTPHVAPQNSTWILSEGTFGRSRKNPVTIDLDGMSEIQGRFYYHQGGFWMESFAGNTAVEIDGTVLGPGFVAPLVNGQTVRFGDKKFRVSVAA